MVYTKRQVELTHNKRNITRAKTKSAYITGEQITAINAAVTSMLLQISAGAIYTDEGEVLEFDIKNRYKVLREVIDKSQVKRFLCLYLYACYRYTNR